jgi:peptidoglycan/LPS O-acetylase OafA/YrhL
MNLNGDRQGLSPRVNNFDFLRLILASMVIFSHSHIILGSDFHREFFHRLTGGQIGGGALAVDAFFILSGFLITKSWLQAEGLQDFLLRRVRRIYPGYLAAVAFCVLVAAHEATISTEWIRTRPSIYHFILGTLDLRPPLPDSFTRHPNPRINPSLWTIRYEFFCYLGVAILGSAGAVRRRYLVLLAFVTSLTVYALQIHGLMRIPGTRLIWFYGDPEYWPRLATNFLAGSVFYQFRDRISWSRWPLVASLAVMAVLSGLPALRGVPIAVPLIGGYILLSLGFLPIRSLQGFARRIDLSYGIYLYGFPIQQLLAEYLGFAIQPMLLSIISVPLAAGMAFLSWKFVESPFLRRREFDPAGCQLASSRASDGSKGLETLGTL